MSTRSWPDVKKMLDDPYVSTDTKERLLMAYTADGGRIPSEDADYYQNRFKFGDDDDAYDVVWDGVSTDEVYRDAQRESEEKGHHDREVGEQVQQKQGELAGVAPPSAGGRGVATSDELFDIAKPALSVFERFIPIDAKVPGDTRGANNPLDYNRDIQTRFDEQRGINFKKMLEEADRLAAAHASLTELKTTSETQLNSLYKTWTGPAANASYEHFTQQIDPNVRDLLPYLERGPQVIRSAVDTVYQACKAKADQVLKLYRQTVGSATPEIADKVMALAKGDFNDQDQILPVAAWVDSVCGSNLEERIRTDNCGLNDGNKQYTIEQCKKWIRESFNVEFWGESARMGMCLQFDKICKDTVEAVDGAWQTINDFFKPYQNEFPQAANAVTGPGAGTGTGTGSGSSGTGSGTGVGTGTGGAGAGGSGTGSPPPVPMPPPGGGTGGNGMGSGGMPSVPSVPSVPTPGTGTDPSLAGGGGTSPSGTLPGQVPGGVPGGPGSPGGGGMPSVPIPGIGGGGLGGGGTGSGLPGTPGAGEPKTVSIKDGNRTITVGEPDARGRSKITIDDGSGKPPKSFTMDFGEAMKTFGGDVPGAGQVDGELEENLVKAGPDGKVVIEDGDTKITAERVPGEPDKVKLTVDDGTPPPSEYTVDFNTGTPGPGSSSFVPSSNLGDLGGVDVPGSGGSSASGFGGGSGGGSGGGAGGGGGGGVPGGAAGEGRSPEAGVSTGAQTPGSSDQKHATVGASASAGDSGGRQGGAMGGMPMGGMGAGAGQGGDQTRGGSKWRTQGQLFDDADPAAHFSGVVGEDPAQRAPRPPKKG